MFDYSNLPKNSKFFDETHKTFIGKIKDESQGKINDEFVGLKSKMYSIKNMNGKESNTVKGVSIATEFNELKALCSTKTILRHKIRTIQSKLHKICTYKIYKKSLSVFDDKRSVLDYGLHRMAYFHKDLRK